MLYVLSWMNWSWNIVHKSVYPLDSILIPEKNYVRLFLFYCSLFNNASILCKLRDDIWTHVCIPWRIKCLLTVKHKLNMQLWLQIYTGLLIKCQPPFVIVSYVTSQVHSPWLLISTFMDKYVGGQNTNKCL